MSAALASLGSGSRGNGTLVRMGDACFLIDCGFTIRDTCERLARLGLGPEHLTAVLVTHEHADHVGGVAPLARRFGVPVHGSYGTLRGHRDWRGVTLKPFNSHESFSVAGVEITPVPVPHDAREPTQFTFARAGRRVGVLTDLGYVTPHVVERFGGCDLLLMESNHDVDMLWGGGYPLRLKRRIAGAAGHLSNDQAVALLGAVRHESLAAVVVGHMSEQNNEPARVRAAFAPVAEGLAGTLSYASQSDGTPWISA